MQIRSWRKVLLSRKTIKKTRWSEQDIKQKTDTQPESGADDHIQAHGRNYAHTVQSITRDFIHYF